MKKIILLFVFAGIIFSLSACGSEPVDLTIWAWNRNVDILIDAVERYKEEVDSEFNATVLSFSQGDIDTKFMAAKELNNPETMADVILVDSMKLRGYYDMWPEIFETFDISDDAAEKFVSSTIEVATINNKLVAMPYGIAPTYVFAYKPLWDTNVINDILENGWTWDDYKTVGLDIISNNTDKDVFMTAYNMRGDDRLYRTMTSQKGEWFMSRDIEVQVGNSNSVQAMSWVKDLYDSGVVGHIDTGDYKSMMINGQIAAQIQGFFLGGQIKSIGEDTSGDWILLPLPSWDENESSASITGGSYLYVNAFSDQTKGAKEFTEWYTLNADALVSGLEIGGIFPALLDAYEHEYFKQEDAFFGNQKYLEQVASNIHEAPAIFASKYNAYNYNQYILGQEDILFNDASIQVTINEVKASILENAQE